MPQGNNYTIELVACVGEKKAGWSPGQMFIFPTWQGSHKFVLDGMHCPLSPNFMLDDLTMTDNEKCDDENGSGTVAITKSVLKFMQVFLCLFNS